VELHYTLLDVFTDTPLAGNPLAVFPQAGDLDPERMRRIAGELNLSESVFVTESDADSGRHAIRILTPTMELPFAGHPTIGAGVALARAHGREGEARLELIEGVGPVPVAVRLHGPDRGRACCTAPHAPTPLEVPIDAASAARVLGLDPGDIWAVGLSAGSGGVPFLFVPVASREALGRVRIDTTAWQAHLAATATPQIYAWWLASAEPAVVHARMLAPGMGIGEDPATGAAAVAFAGELARCLGVREERLQARIHQGEDMGRPSRLDLDIDLARGRVTRVALSGAAVVVGEGVLRLP
jgi:trans-2,3-dihydro-3-hydroxyanthranilate isomerase